MHRMALLTDTFRHNQLFLKNLKRTSTKIITANPGDFFLEITLPIRQLKLLSYPTQSSLVLQSHFSLRFTRFLPAEIQSAFLFSYADVSVASNSPRFLKKRSISINFPEPIMDSRLQNIIHNLQGFNRTMIKPSVELTSSHRI